MKRLIGATVIWLGMVSFIDPHFVPANEPFRQELLSKLNALRTQGCYCGSTYMQPVEPLTWNVTLEFSAYSHAADMSENKYFSHYSLDGKRLRDRNILAGYTFTGYQSFRIGENIAQGQLSIKEVMRDWSRSPDHCKNLMDPNFKEVGLAVVNSYWVQDFGVRHAFGEAERYTAKNSP